MDEPTFLIKPEIEEKSFGRFIIEPLTQGYGQTLGNSLRRVLLTSLSGAAVVSVKIEGVKHQFTTLPGLKEDIAELLLNVKKIRIKMEGVEEATLKISKHGPGVVTAGDIEAPAGVTIINPELVLGTLADKKSELVMECAVTRGYGYVITEEHRVDEVGVISIDSLFSPVVRVNYRVEATRVGRMTNLDKLVMEIWTDGSVNPIDALKQAATILVTYFKQLVDPKPIGKVEPIAVSTAISDEILKMRIEELDIPTRIVNALGNGGIETIGQLMNAPKEDLMKVKNLGAKSLSIIGDKLKEKGVVLSL